MDINLNKKRLILSAGELSRLVADAADATMPVSLSLRGRLGAEAHRAYQNQRSRACAFRQEVHLDVPILPDTPEARGWEIRIRGRLDGLSEELDQWVIEELKTVALPASRFRSLSPADFPRHRRQLEIYLHLLSLARPEKPAIGKLIYLNLANNRKRTFKIPYDRGDIEPFIWEVIASLIDREVRRAQELQLKREAAAQMRFPFKAMRPGQEEMIQAINDALEKSSALLMEAPTGLGKTAAALFAALPFALERDKQVLFLTSKTTQQDLIFATARLLRSDRSFPRTILLRARQKLCFLEGGECAPDECEYLEDFQQRIRRCNALPELLAEGDIHPDRLLEIARRDRLCPHALQLGLTEEMDLIIGDYNYVFDPGCRLERLFSEGDPSRLVLIVDEAHNLPDRARQYYSPHLSWNSVMVAAKKLNESGNDSFSEPLQAIQAQFEHYLSQAPAHPEPCPVRLSLSAWSQIASDFESAIIPYWFGLAEEEQSWKDNPVLSLQRQLEDFLRVLNLESENFAHLLHRHPEIALEVICLDASPYLQATFSSVYSSICISATLQPFDAYARLLGLDRTTSSLALPSPFPQEHCQVFIDSSVTTLYREREANLDAIAERIEHFYVLVPGNILTFFPSFELMQRLLQKISIKNILVQEEGFSDLQRNDQLSAFKESRHAMLCSVMGGVFAEGIDLPGRMAEAAIIVGVPLPMVCVENELLRAYYESSENRGFEFAYLYPGMRRAIQAAGRVIRNETDRGIILLLDRRYAQREYQRLLPQHWYKQSPGELVCKEWEETIRSMFHMKASKL